MTVQLLIEWGRAKSGRVWHLLSGGEWVEGTQRTFCELDRPIVGVTRDLPPRGETPCPRCVEVVEALTFACLQAAAQKGRPASSPPGTSPEP